jgi:Protein of unknown function (DUF2695)
MLDNESPYTREEVLRYSNELPHFDIDAVAAWLENNGGFCDCEVILNARDHWEENR